MPLQRETWRKALKLRVIAQTVAAIVSAIAAIHQLLKRERVAGSVVISSAPWSVSIMAHMA
ncbi:MAG: hypothetical protein ACRYFS_10865 [Janthinobacterium lividum]